MIRKMLLVITALGLYFCLFAPIHKWNCNRVGMDFAYFVGCVIRGVK